MDFATLMWTASLLVGFAVGQDEEVLTVKINPAGEFLSIKVGESVFLSCQATGTGGQEADIKWYLDDQEQTSTDPNERINVEVAGTNILTLNFLEVRDGDNFRVKCEASVGGGEPVSASIKLEAYESLQFLSDKAQRGILGEDGTVVCDSNGSPMRTWRFFNKTQITTNNKYIIEGEKLTIKTLTFEDSQTYICQLRSTSSGESIYTDIAFTVVQLPTIALAPTIQPNNPVLGDEVKLTCTAEGVPKPTYLYKRGDQQITDIPGEQHVDEVDGVLTLSSVTRNSEGVYTCVASNEGGNVEKEVTLNIRIPPEITTEFQTLETSQNEARSVVCKAKGAPAPTITWSKKDAVADFTTQSQEGGPYVVIGSNPNPDSTAEVEVDTTLVFSSIRPEDAGEYICKANSVVGSDEATVTMNVKYAPHFDTGYTEDIFWGWKGHRANVTCQASANDLATFTWYIPAGPDNLDVSQATPISNEPPFEIQDLQRFPDYHLSSSSILVTVTGDDKDIYQHYLCEANNGKQAARIVELKEAMEPGQPALKVEDSGPTSVDLKVTKPANDGGQEVTSFKYSYYKAGDQANKISDKLDKNLQDVNYFRVSNLDPKTDYIFEIQAVNIVGAGMVNQITFKTTEIQAPSAMKMTSNVEGTSPDSYTVAWETVENGGAPITMFTFTVQKAEVGDPDAVGGWSVSGYVDNGPRTLELKDSPDATQFTITGLDADSYYDLRMMATNSEGDGDMSQYVIHTPKGGASSKTGSAGVGSAAMIGIIIAIILLIFVVVIIVYIVSKRRREQGAAKSGESADGAAAEDGKAQAEEEKLIQKDDTVKTETETGGGGGNPAQEEGNKPEEYEPDTKPDVKVDDAENIPLADAIPENPTEAPAAPMPVADIKVTPGTPDKPEDPAA